MGVAKIARRTFLIGAGVAAGGLAVGYYYVRKPYPNPLEETLGPGESTLNPYVKIGADNRITVIVPRAEMGQGVRTTLAALVAEELEVGLEDIHVEHGPASSAYYNAAMLEEGSPFAFFNESFIAESLRSATGPIGKSLGLQATGGSSSLRDGYYRMRKAGCVARMLLVEAAARRWGLDAEGLEIADGRITDPASGSSASYGNLAREAAEVELPKNVRLKSKREWKLLGRSQPRLDIPAKVTGQAEFGIDIELPDMLYGTVKMSPRFGAKAKSADTEAALAVKGVRKVVPIDLPVGSGFGIIADNTWAAFMGAQALEVEWEEASYPRTTEALFAELGKTLDGPADYSLRNDGDVDIAFADAPREEILETEYSVPWLAHACMEPMNATAQWKDGILDIWCGHQSPTLVQWTSAPLVDAESDAVRVHTTYLGGGFGRRIEIDFVQYAVVMAKETGGQPIKVTWTREEDTTHDTYRPASVGRMRARVRKGEVPEAVDISVVGQSPTHGMMGRFFPEIPLVGPDPGLTQGAHDQPYRIANYRVSQTRQELAVPVGIWRSVGNSINGYFHECFMDEIAEAAEIDPLSLRLQLMSDYPAAVGVLQKVADMSGWGRDVALGKGLGLAHVLSFGTWTAQVIEVTNGEDGISIDRVWCVADVGEAMDPENIKAQMMSGIVFGLSAAIGQEITFADGEVQQFNFPDYDAMRMYQCPIIEIEVLQNYHRMGGAGEPGTPPSVPALANAIHAATGKRIRRMPLSSEVKFV